MDGYGWFMDCYGGFLFFFEMLTTLYHMHPYASIFMLWFYGFYMFLPISTQYIPI